MVHFVGAGPGAVDLITLRGQRLLSEADVIIYAGSLVNPELLSYAKENCMIYDSATMCLEDVIAVYEAAEKNGYTTVRLHTGDPSLYGAIREQMDVLEARGIAYDVCPGVSSLFGAAATLQCEYTLPDVSQSVIITRGEGRTPVPPRESLQSFASHHATMVLFLSSGMAKKVQRELIEGGYTEDTPVGIVYKATWPDEKKMETTLGKLAETMETEQIHKTALIVVGDVLGNRYEKSKLYDATFSTGYREAKTQAVHATGAASAYETVPASQAVHATGAANAFETVQTDKNDILMIACSRRGHELMQRVHFAWEEQMAQMPKFAGRIICKTKCNALPDVSDVRSVADIVAAHITTAKVIVFFSATGIAVRTMAPFLRHKSVDPAVIVLDEMGNYVVSLVSGHAGAANEYTNYIATLSGAKPVVTTATDVEGKFAVDVFAKKNRLTMLDWTFAKEISAAILRGETVSLDTTYEIVGNVPDELSVNDSTAKYHIKVTSDVLEIYQKKENELILVPQCYMIGIGCKSNTSEGLIYEAVKICMDMYGADMKGVAAVASIDLKEEEPGLVSFCRSLNVPFMTYDANTLNAVTGSYTESAFVEQVTGVDNVCERSAVACVNTFKRVDGSYGHYEFVCRKTAREGVTVAIVQVERKLLI